jgi:hypothetical protein
VSSTAEVYERAVIGAVMKDPWQAVQLRGWLNAEDFSDPWNREIYRALVDDGLYQHRLLVAQPAEHKPAILAQMLYARLQRVAADRGWQLSAQDWAQTSQYLTDLPQRHAPHAAHAVDYGRVVAQESFDRTVGGQGEHAEWAVISALLQHPDQAEHLGTWLRSDDFQEPWLGRIYHSLAEGRLRLCTHPTVVNTPQAQRPQVLAQMLIEDLAHKAYVSHPDSARLSEQEWAQGWAPVKEMIDDLATGQYTPHPEQAARLGQRVLQSSIQHKVATGFSEGLQRAELFPGSLVPEVDTMLRQVQELQARWDQAMGSRTAETEGHATRGPERPGMPATEDAVLGSLVKDPSQIEHVRSWLRPEDFTAPGRATLYRTIVQTVDAGRTVDPIMLAWHAQQNGLHPRDIQAERIWAIAEHGEPGRAADGGRVLLEAGISHHVTTARTVIETAGGDMASTPAQALGTAREHLKAASAQASRLSQQRQGTYASAGGMR